MVSTKRMDSSFGKNAANRVEESYGDAKNLRLPTRRLHSASSTRSARWHSRPRRTCQSGSSTCSSSWAGRMTPMT